MRVLQPSCNSTHLYGMNYTLSTVTLALGLLSSCDDGLYCDLSFQTVGFTWTDSTHAPHHLDAVVRETQDSLVSQFNGLPDYFTIASDEHQSLFFNHSYHVDVYVYDANDSLLAQNEWVITADRCHIQKVSGPEFLP
jgi:hypothetical protein